MRTWASSWSLSHRRPWSPPAAMLKNLDLVVSCDSAVAHLAGAMGVPAWVPLSASSAWPWMVGREDTPWYPGTRLFRQSRLLDWAPVLERMAHELAQLVPMAESIGPR